MSSGERSRTGAYLLIAALGLIPAPARAAERQEYGPDPASVLRFGPAYRYPQAGWIVLHIEGEPYDRGYQHGRLLAPEIADYLKTLAVKRSPKAPGAAWESARTLVNALFLRRYDKEYLEEMKGTADGAAAAGATFEGRAVDLLDVVAINSEIEADFLDSALRATAEGLEGRTFRDPAAVRPRMSTQDHCSAFAAVGPATADGQVVFGHITMWNLAMARHFNVWLDVKPAQGHRVVMQTYPGGIQSGMDYYMNDAGLIVAETTIGQTRFDPEGVPLASRIRRALQYADSIESTVAILANRNNGLYSNEWLLADTKTNEIAMFELGTGKSKLWRSSKGEWFGGTPGFYWGCNNAKDLDVRMETVPSVEGKPANLVWRASDRDHAWLLFYNQSKGKIDADFATRAYSSSPLAARSSLDAKFTTTAMAKEMKSRALFGPPIGRTWEPSEAQRETPGIRPLVPNDWVTLTVDAPAAPLDDAPTSVDLSGLAKGGDHRPDNDPPPAWHGTILPRADTDTWLAAAFADFERFVAMEDSLKAEDGRDPIELAHFGSRARHHAATRRLGRDVALARTIAEPDNHDWYEIAAGKGVLLLSALRDLMGPAPFAKMMDDFGRAHAGHAVEVAQFRDHAARAAAGKPIREFFDRWLDQTGIPGAPSGGVWAVDSFEEEPEKALIAYGTLKEGRANREGAERLRRAIADRWSNFDVPIKADSEMTEDDWKDHHVLIVGRPETNSAAARAAKSLPVAFGPTSFALRGETYGHAGTAVIVAGENPANPRFEVVVFAGLGAEATWHCSPLVGGRRLDHAEVVLIAEKCPPREMVARAPEKKLTAGVSGR